ncbi:MAG: hypothetical protein WD845_18715 [Pirellulales bacterium]
MRVRLKPLATGPRAPWLGLALAVLSCALVARATAQLPGIHPDPSDLHATQIDGGLQRELARARAAVAEARSAAIAAKAELEAAVTSRSAENDRWRPAAAQPAGQPASNNRSAIASIANAAATEIETLKRLIAELKSERIQLLAHLTTEHPLILDADMRLDEYQRQLVVLTSAPATHQATVPADGIGDTDGIEVRTAESMPAPPLEMLDGQSRQSPSDESLRLEQALANWDSAQESLEAAMDAESATAERIVALTSRQTAARVPPVAPHAPATQPADIPQVSAEPHGVSPQRAARSSQPIVLAALMVALVIAAFASVKLARANDESVFAGADDAAAALSLPVVGVIPATAAALAHGTLFQRHRTLTFMGQVLVAVVVFALVAFCVQNPSFIWRLVTEPWAALR